MVGNGKMKVLAPPNRLPIAAMPARTQTRFLHQFSVAEFNALLKVLPAGAPAIPAAAVAVTAP